MTYISFIIYFHYILSQIYISNNLSESATLWNNTHTYFWRRFVTWRNRRSPTSGMAAFLGVVSWWTLFWDIRIKRITDFPQERLYWKRMNCLMEPRLGVGSLQSCVQVEIGTYPTEQNFTVNGIDWAFDVEPRLAISTSPRISPGPPSWKIIINRRNFHNLKLNNKISKLNIRKHVKTNLFG